MADEPSSAADDLRAILSYLDIAATSVDAQRITGLAPSAMSDALSGIPVRNVARRRHIAVVASIVRDLAAARMFATGVPERAMPAAQWLHSAVVVTSVGRRAPIEIFSDADLALEALDALRR